MPPVPSQLTRRPRERPPPYARKKETPKKKKDTPKTTAIQSHTKENLTLHDWLSVVEFVDSNNFTQEEVVKHFANRKNGGALIFSQGALSRHLSKKGRAADQAKAAATPTALSSKRLRIVTRPDVEKALWLWVKHMESKRETVSGPMLEAKRAKFEKEMDVPEAERMKSAGWIPKFCKAYVTSSFDSCLRAGTDTSSCIAPGMVFERSGDTARPHQWIW